MCDKTFVLYFHDQVLQNDLCLLGAVWPTHMNAFNYKTFLR